MIAHLAACHRCVTPAYVPQPLEERWHAPRRQESVNFVSFLLSTSLPGRYAKSVAIQRCSRRAAPHADSAFVLLRSARSEPAPASLSSARGIPLAGLRRLADCTTTAWSMNLSRSDFGDIGRAVGRCASQYGPEFESSGMRPPTIREAAVQISRIHQIPEPNPRLLKASGHGLRSWDGLL
jgi:hypothetical protein